MGETAASERRLFAPEELGAIFQVLRVHEIACVLMGGQASNFWARTYLSVEPQLAAIQEHFGFVSKDLDVQGNRAAAELLADKLGTKLKPVSLREAFGNLLAGQLVVSVAGEPMKIEVLRRIPGLSEAEVNRLATTVSIAGAQVRVLNPVAALMAKAWNVAHIRKEGRHDAEQLLALVCASRAYFRELLAAAKTQDDLRHGLKLIERFLRFAELPTGRSAAEVCGVNWSWVLPHCYLAADRRSAVVRLRTHRLPRWLAHIRAYRRGLPATVEVIRIVALLTESAEPECVPAPTVERANRYAITRRKAKRP